MAVLMLDIDHFKSINDTYGHANGDLALKAFAATVQQNLRENDLIGRLGGEEFAVLLYGCLPGEAARVAERIRASVAASAIDTDVGATITPTVSIGLVEARPGAKDIERLLKDADAALYAAKAAGRNRVEVHIDGASA